MSIFSILILIGFLVFCVKLSAFPSMNVPIYTIRLRSDVQLTSSGTSISTRKVPFNCRVLKIQAGVDAIGGTADPTDVDIDVENGAVDLCDPLPAVDSSAIVAGGVEDDPDSGVETLSAGDILHLDATITGGTSPTVDGIWADVLVQRLPD